MLRSGLPRLLLLALLCAVPPGCDDPAGPEEQTADESRLIFVRVADDAPPLADTVVSFWAVRGQEREVQIRYVHGGYLAKCMRFRVPAQAVRDRDSVRITVRVVDRKRFVFEFSPGGLKFDPAHPAELEVRYRWADPDFNRDGVVDHRDEAVARGFGFWRQERVGEKWVRMETARSEVTLEATTRVFGFTRYALASE